MNESESFKNHPAQYLPNYGMAADLKTLDEVFKTIHLMPLEEQAKYADVICRQMATDVVFVQRQLGGIEATLGRESYGKMNATTVGNLAYLALNASSEGHRNICLDVLKGYKQWRINQKCVLL
jgi:hypothetical protein